MDKLIMTKSTQLYTTTQRYRLNFKIWRWNNYNTHVKDTSKELSRIHSYYQRRRTMDHSSRHRLLPFQTCSINNLDNSFFFLSIFFYRLSKTLTLTFNKRHRIKAKGFIVDIGTMSSIRPKNVITQNVYISTIQTNSYQTNSASNNIPTVIWTRTKTH